MRNYSLNFIIHLKSLLEKFVNSATSGVRDYIHNKFIAPLSPEWFANYTDAELRSEREQIRLEYCSTWPDYRKADRLQRVLWKYDDELSRRAWGDEIPHAPDIHREHGWYLPNDD